MYTEIKNIVVNNAENFVFDEDKLSDCLFLDFETTGLDAETDEIIQVAIGQYIFKNGVYELKTENWFVKPDKWTLTELLKREEKSVLETTLSQARNLLNRQNQRQYDFQTTINDKLKILPVLFKDESAETKTAWKQLKIDNGDFLTHWQDLTKLAYEKGISQAENNEKLKNLLTKKIIITYNGINFDEKFLPKNIDCADIDVYRLASRYFKTTYSKKPVLVNWLDENNSEKILINLKQNTLGTALACENVDAHNADADIKQLAFIFNKLWVMVKNTLALNGFVLPNSKAIPLNLLTKFDNNDYLNLIQTKNIAEISKIIYEMNVLLKQMNVNLVSKDLAKGNIQAKKFTIGNNIYLFGFQNETLQVLKNKAVIFNANLSAEDLETVKRRLDEFVVSNTQAQQMQKHAKL